MWTFKSHRSIQNSRGSGRWLQRGVNFSGCSCRYFSRASCSLVQALMKRPLTSRRAFFRATGPIIAAHSSGGIPSRSLERLRCTYRSTSSRISTTWGHPCQRAGSEKPARLVDQPRSMGMASVEDPARVVSFPSGAVQTWPAQASGKRPPNPLQFKTTTDGHRYTQIRTAQNRPFPWRQLIHGTVTQSNAKQD